MGLTYDAANRSWVYVPEKTDYQTDRPTDLPTSHVEYIYGGGDGDWGPMYPIDVSSDEEIGNAATNDYNAALNQQGQTYNTLNTAKNNFYSQVQNIASATSGGSYNYLSAKQTIQSKKQDLIDAGFSDADAQKIIDYMTGPTGQFRNFYSNERITPWDPSVLPGSLSNTTRQRTDLGENFNRYADGRTGYYINETPQGKAAKAIWDQAVKDDNLDIIGRYGSLEAYAKQDYLNQITDPTKTSADIAKIRGSESASLSPLVTGYREQVFPDAVAQQTRDAVQNKIFGLQQIPGQTGYQFRDVNQELSKFITTNSSASSLWTQAKNESSLASLTGATTPGPWTRLTKSLKVDNSFLKDQDLFGSLIGRVATLNSQDPADQKIISDNQALVDSIKQLQSDNQFKELIGYKPEINEAFNKSVQEAEAQQTRKFGDLRQSVLQDTINALIDAKRQENNLSIFRSSSIGQEISKLQTDINSSLLGDLNIGGVLPGTTQKSFKSKLDLGLGDIFGTKNGLIYNWEDWFNNTIEKKYAGDIDIPNDYVPEKLRTVSNGFIDDKTIQSWKKYDDANAALKINPFDTLTKATLDGAPTNYVAPENRKVVKQEWIDYEAKLKAAGYVDPATVASWTKYDQAYQQLQVDPNDQNAKLIYDQRPADYIQPDKRMDKDVQFAKDFFSTYLKPRFDSSQSIAEFQDYIDVTKNTQNPFQTQDRLDALKLAAQTSVSNWFASLQRAGDSKFNTDYYFNPIEYLKQNGVGDPNNPLLPGAAFIDYVNTTAGQNAIRQSKKVNDDWEAAKRGDNTTDDYGNTINWAQQAYRYGIDVNDKAAFAQLHYQLVGQQAPEKDANGNIVKDENGNPSIQRFDPAPDVYAPQVAKLYITQILTPFLIDKANKIGSVFGQFVKPADYVDEVLKAVNLPQNKAQWGEILKNYNIDPNASLNEIRTTLIDALSQDSTAGIKKSIGDFIQKNQGKLPTQSDIGVEYIQRAGQPSGTITEPSGVYAVFKKAGFSGSEQDFYSTFMPDATQEDINVLNASYTTSNKTTPLLPTITGGGLEQIATMAQLFGDSDISEVLGTAGVAIPSGTKPSLFTQLITTSGEDYGITDPFADTTTVSGVTKTTKSSIGIGNPFDDIGINDPFSDTSDPFTSSSSLFATTKSSVVNPTIVGATNLAGFSTSKTSKNFASSLFDSFGGGFGF